MPNDKTPPVERALDATIEEAIDSETKLLAAIAYGEASVDDDPQEVLGIAYAVSNRSRAWKKTVSEVLKADPNYTYAANGSNKRFNLLKSSSLAQINKSPAMRTAVNAAMNAWNEKGDDPSNGAYWWDGTDLKEMRNANPRIKQGFKYGAEEHNIYKMDPVIIVVIRRWQVTDRKSGKIVEGLERGRFDAVYISTSARGRTIFWQYNPDYVKATGAKDYK